MKTRWVLVGVAVLCILVQVGLAQPPQDRPARQGRAVGEGGGAGPVMGGGMYQGLDLTQEQQAKMAQIREKLRAEMQAAETPEARRELFTKMRDEMQKILTPEQQAKMRERTERPAAPVVPIAPVAPADAVRPQPRDPLQVFDAVAPRLELTEEQQANIAKLREEAMKKLVADINGVLNDNQRARYAQAQRRMRAAQERPRSEAQAAPEKPAGEVRPERPAREGADRPQRTRPEGATRPEGTRGERPARGEGGRPRQQ